ncbi:MAG TPA: citrate/2-methylcitrate synthase [Tepidisphaeraceae bacterium]|jgi:citrate synthase|nr:citrate/2-methylcitrate synthase [Tepidisphaeraceae bacterium]
MSEAASTVAKKAKGGLEGIVAVQSSICFIDGDAGRLVYRGYDIGELVEHVTFEETAALLWDGELPNRGQLGKLRADLGRSAALPSYVLDLLKELPRQTQPIDALRTAVSALGASDPDLEHNDSQADRRKAIRITAQLPTITAAFHRLRNGQQAIAPDPELSVAANFLYMLNGKKPHETLSRVLDAALVLHAEHGMNASTFAARVTAATMADMHAAITSACAALKGPLHGGANQDVMHLLLSCGDAASAEKKVREMLATNQKVPGFGHRVYHVFDPRAHFLRKMSKQLGEAAGNTKWYEMSERLIPIMKDTINSDGKPKNLNPNVDFFSASTYYTMGIPLDLFIPIFAIARVAGWSAHIMEQHHNNRIIRPTDDYTGPFDKKVVPIDQRK